MQVPFDYAQRRVFDFAAAKPVCCAQDDIAGSETRSTRYSTAPTQPLFSVQRFARMDYANKRRFPECSCSRKWSILGLTSRRNASISAGVAVWSGSLS
jgi:hypothetical protein